MAVPDNSESRIPRTKSRRPKAPVITGSVIVLVCAFAFVLTSMSADDRRPVLVVTKVVPAGHALQRSDVRVENISVTQGVRSIPASSLSSMIGRQVAVPLAPDTLLSPTQLGDVSGLDPGQVNIGLALKAGQFPPSLAAGDRVRVIDTTNGIAIADQAIVSSVSKSSNDTSLSNVIGLQLNTNSAGSVVTAGSASHVALVGLPGAT